MTLLLIPEVHQSHLISEVGADLFADSLGHAHGCHSSGLGTAYHAIAGVAVLVQILCQLGGLPAACLSNNDHYVVVPVNGKKGMSVRKQSSI